MEIDGTLLTWLYLYFGVRDRKGVSAEWVADLLYSVRLNLDYHSGVRFTTTVLHSSLSWGACSIFKETI